MWPVDRAAGADQDRAAGRSGAKWIEDTQRALCVPVDCSSVRRIGQLHGSGVHLMVKCIMDPDNGRAV